MGVSMKEVFVKMSMDMGDLKRGFDSFQKQTTTAENKTKSLDGQMNKFAGTIKKLAITVGAGLAFKKLITSTSDYEDKIANLNTLIPGQTAAIGDLEKGFLDLAGPLGSAGELAEAAYDAISGGVEPGQAVEFIAQAAMFAKANLIELKDATDVLTTVMNTYGASAGSVAEITDTLTTVVRLGKTHGDELATSLGMIAGTANTVGIEFQDLAASLVTTTAGGVRTRQSVTALKAIIANIAAPTNMAKDAAKKLGVQFDLAGIKSKGWAGFLKDLTDKAAGNTQAQKDLFGSVEAFNAIAVLTSEEGMKKFIAAQEALKNKTDATKEAFDKQQETISATMDSLKNNVEATFIKVFLPVLKDIAKWIENNREDITSFFESLAATFVTIVKFSAEAIKALAKVFDWIKENVPIVKESWEGLNNLLLILNKEKLNETTVAIEEQSSRLKASFEQQWKQANRLEAKYRGFLRTLGPFSSEWRHLMDEVGGIPATFKTASDKVDYFNNIMIGVMRNKFGEKLADDYKKYIKGIGEGTKIIDAGTVTINAIVPAIEKKRKKIIETTKKIIPFNEAIKGITDKAKEGTLKINDLTGAYDKYYPEVIASEEKTKEFLDVLDDLRKNVAPGAAIQLDAIRAQFTQLEKPTDDLIGEIESGITPLENFGDEISYTTDMSKELNDEMLNSIDAFGDMPKTISGVEKRMKELKEEYSQSKISQAEFEFGMAALETQMKSLEGWAELLSHTFGKLESVMSKATGIDFSSPMGALSSIAEKILTTIGETDWEKYGQAMGKSLGISSEMANKLGALSKEMEGVNAALFTMMDEIISDENISNIEDFNKWLAEIARMMPAVAANETPIRELEEAFSALLASSGDIGYLGQAFHEIAGNAADLGFELESINSFMENEMIAGTDGYRAAIEANFTDAIIPVFQKQMELQDKIADNKPLVDGIEGWGRAIIAFGNTNKKILQTDMDGFIKGTLDGYDDLIEKAGFSVPQALELIAPQLGTLIALAQDHGLVLDDNIQSLIDLADENNISVERRKTAEEQMVDLLEELVDILRGDLPAAMEDFANEAVGQFGKVRTSINDATGELSTFLDTIPDSVGVTADFGHMGGPGMGEIPGFQAGTGGVFVPTPRQFTVGEGGAERVEMRRGSMRVTPLENEAGASGNVTNVNINIQSMDSRGVYEVTRDQIVPLIYEFSKKGGVTIDRRAVI